GEGHVVRIGADAQVRRRPWRRAGHKCGRCGGDEQRPRESTPYRRHACSLRNRQKVNEVAKYYTRCRSSFAPAPGVLRIYLLQLVLPFDCLQPEHEQRAARVADVDVVTEG